MSADLIPAQSIARGECAICGKTVAGRWLPETASMRGGKIRIRRHREAGKARRRAGICLGSGEIVEAMTTGMSAGDLKRFWTSAPRGDAGECWEWTGTRMPGKFDYGQICIWGRPRLAHRISYELHNGALADEAYVLHKCDNPPCVNPAHLFVGTARDNTQDMISKERALHLPLPGAANGNARLTDEKIRLIFALNAAGESRKVIASQVGVSEGSLSPVLRRKTWRHVAIPENHLAGVPDPDAPPGLKNSDKTHCPNGHPFDAANTRVYHGRRYCRKCHLVHARASREKARERAAKKSVAALAELERAREARAGA